MAKPSNLFADPCPVARTADIIGDAWCLLIVRNAFDGMHRFGEFLADLGLARNILADRLRRLVDAGVLEQVPASDGSAYSEYILTRAGQDLFPVIVALRQWGEAHLYAKGEKHSALLERGNSRPLPRMRPLDREGHPLAPGATYVRKLGDAKKA